MHSPLLSSLLPSLPPSPPRRRISFLLATRAGPRSSSISRQCVPGDFRDFWIEISNGGWQCRGQLHSLMDPPHITVTYTYVSFVKSEYRQRPFYVSSYGPRLKREIDVLYFACLPVRVIGRSTAPPSLSSSFLPRVIRVTFNISLLYRVYTCQGVKK